MSNDLISRSALAKEVREWMNCDERCCQCEYGDGNCFYKDVIFRQPCAYDTEKVVEKLKRGKFTEQETILSDTHQGFNAGIEFSIKEVKSGGIDG